MATYLTTLCGIIEFVHSIHTSGAMITGRQHRVKLCIMIHLPAMGLVDVNTLVARFYYELNVSRTIFGEPVIVKQINGLTDWSIGNTLRGIEKQLTLYDGWDIRRCPTNMRITATYYSRHKDHYYVELQLDTGGEIAVCRGRNNFYLRLNEL
jgi:hypothetical protein